MTAERLAERIINDNDESSYANRCTAARLPNKRESFFMFFRVAEKAALRQDIPYTVREVEQCAALLQEHYSQHIVQLQFYKARKHQA